MENLEPITNDGVVLSFLRRQDLIDAIEVLLIVQGFSLLCVIHNIIPRFIKNHLHLSQNYRWGLQSIYITIFVVVLGLDGKVHTEESVVLISVGISLLIMSFISIKPDDILSYEMMRIIRIFSVAVSYTHLYMIYEGTIRTQWWQWVLFDQLVSTCSYYPIENNIIKIDDTTLLKTLLSTLETPIKLANSRIQSVRDHLRERKDGDPMILAADEDEVQYSSKLKEIKEKCRKKKTKNGWKEEWNKYLEGEQKKWEDYLKELSLFSAKEPLQRRKQACLYMILKVSQYCAAAMILLSDRSSENKYDMLTLGIMSLGCTNSTLLTFGYKDNNRHDWFALINLSELMWINFGKLFPLLFPENKKPWDRQLRWHVIYRFNNTMMWRLIMQIMIWFLLIKYNNYKIITAQTIVVINYAYYFQNILDQSSNLTVLFHTHSGKLKPASPNIQINQTDSDRTVLSSFRLPNPKEDDEKRK